MTKKLIVAGCSFTKNKFQSLVFWPEIVAEKLGMELINLGRSGASNQYIHDVTVDKVYETKNIGLVISAWTGFNRRIAVEAGIQYIDPTLTGHAGPEVLTPDVSLTLTDAGNISSDCYYPRYMIEKGIRNMLTMKKFCSHLPHLQFSSLFICSPLLEKGVCDIAVNYKPFTHLDKPTTIGWPFSKLIGGYNIHDLMTEKGVIDKSELNRGHPNQEGHEIISNIIVDKYGEIYG